MCRLEFPIPSKLLCIIHPTSVELVEYARTQSIFVPLVLDYENIKESPCDQDEYIDIDYGIVYGLRNEEVEMETEALN